MTIVLVLFILLVIALPIVVTTLLVLVITSTIRIHQSCWVAAHPEGQRIDLEHLPRRLQSLFAEISGPLIQAGFVNAGVFHAPEFGQNVTWTQILFVNRLTCDRASLASIREHETEYSAVFIATERPDGFVIVTTVLDPASDRGGPCNIPAGLAQHAEEVTKADQQRGSIAPRGVLPDVGAEQTWLADRSASVAQDIASELHFPKARKGDVYRISWIRAFHLACHQPIGQPRIFPRGFEIIPTGTNPPGQA
jgi:hypothetical protein